MFTRIYPVLHPLATAVRNHPTETTGTIGTIGTTGTTGTTLACIEISQRKFRGRNFRVADF